MDEGRAEVLETFAARKAKFGSVALYTLIAIPPVLMQILPSISPWSFGVVPLGITGVAAGLAIRYSPGLRCPVCGVRSRLIGGEKFCAGCGVIHSVPLNETERQAILLKSDLHQRKVPSSFIAEIKQPHPVGTSPPPAPATRGAKISAAIGIGALIAMVAYAYAVYLT